MDDDSLKELILENVKFYHLRLMLIDFNDIAFMIIPHHLTIMLETLTLHYATIIVTIV